MKSWYCLGWTFVVAHLRLPGISAPAAGRSGPPTDRSASRRHGGGEGWSPAAYRVVMRGRRVFVSSRRRRSDQLRRRALFLSMSMVVFAAGGAPPHMRAACRRAVSDHHARARGAPPVWSGPPQTARRRTFCLLPAPAPSTAGRRASRCRRRRSPLLFSSSHGPRACATHARAPYLHPGRSGAPHPRPLCRGVFAAP